MQVIGSIGAMFQVIGSMFLSYRLGHFHVSMQRLLLRLITSPILNEGYCFQIQKDIHTEYDFVTIFHFIKNGYLVFNYINITAGPFKNTSLWLPKLSCYVKFQLKWSYRQLIF